MLELDLILEVSAVVLGLGYLYFLIREKIICWVFGVASSLLSIALFYRTGLYSESILYLYYVVIGIYGFIKWRKSKEEDVGLTIGRLKPIAYIYILVIGSAFVAALGYYFKNFSDAKAPYLDAGTTIFSFIASYLEANKIIEAWLFWVVINLATLVLYFNLDLNIYWLLTLLYLVFSFVGYRQWNRKLDESITVE